MSNDDTSDFLLGSGVPSAVLKEVGDRVKGYVTAKAMRQQTDFKTNEPLFFDDGEKRMQLVLTLATEERDDEIENDDGSRRVYIKANFQKATARALRAVGARDIEIGGLFAAEVTDIEKPKKRGESGAKVYEVEYTLPTQDSQKFLTGGGDDEAENDDDGWEEDDEHVTGEDGTRYVYNADSNDWDEWEPPAPAKKPPAKKAAPTKKAAPAKAAAPRKVPAKKAAPARGGKYAEGNDAGF